MEHHQITYHKVSRETFSGTDALIEKHRPELESYLDQLIWWNNRINLVSRGVSRETLAEHVRHSMLLTPFEPFTKADTVIDSGTGGGLPGIPLAIAARDKQFILNDIVSKKMVAVRQMARELGLGNVKTFDRSIGELTIPASALLVSKHAFRVNELWEMVKEKPWQTVVFYKGLTFEDELKGIDESLRIECFDLSGESEFYRGKALIFLNRFDT